MGIARWGLGDPEWPEDRRRLRRQVRLSTTITETPNTLPAGFNYGDRELVFEVRGNLTGGEGTRQGASSPRVRERRGGRGARRRGSAGGASGRSGPDPGRTGQQSDQRRGRQSVLRHRRLGGDERSGLPGLQGREQRTDHGRAPRTRQPGGDATGLHMQNFLAGLQIAQREGSPRSALQRRSQRVPLPPGQHQLSRRPQADTSKPAPSSPATPKPPR